MREMEGAKRIKVVRTPQLEDVPELIHHIQSLLPLKEAARTCVLSKSWLRAWSTIPTLRFRQVARHLNKQQQREYMNLIDRTLERYLLDDIPITSFKLQVDIHSETMASHLQKWIRQLVSLSCLTDISIKSEIHTLSCQLPDVIFSGENLKSVSHRLFTFDDCGWRHPISLTSDSLFSVRELYLDLVVMEGSFPRIINSRFPFLESLTIKINWLAMDILDITSLSLKRLIIKLRDDYQIGVQVFAPKLLYCSYTGGGMTLPDFVFTSIAPKEIELNLKLKNSIEISFFLKLRETLNLPCKFNIKISISYDKIKRFDVKVDDLRKQLILCPAKNVHQLSFQVCPCEDLWCHSEFFDSFFSICNPCYIKAIKSSGQDDLKRY